MLLIRSQAALDQSTRSVQPTRFAQLQESPSVTPAQIFKQQNTLHTFQKFLNFQRMHLSSAESI